MLPVQGRERRGREFFVDNLLVRIHFIIEMIWWTGLAPWKFEFPFPGSLISTFLVRSHVLPGHGLAASWGGPTPYTLHPQPSSSSSLLLSRLEFSDTKVYEP